MVVMETPEQNTQYMLNALVTFDLPKFPLRRQKLEAATHHQIGRLRNFCWLI